jgi:spore coat polysaccharide biosynthesis protein SpsF
VKLVGIVQARTGSTRLPGKVLMDIAGSPMVVHVLRRVKAVTGLEEVVLATTKDVRDDPLVEIAAAEGVRPFRGSERDLVARYRDAAEEAGAEGVVRITADCPLVDPGVVDLVISELVGHRDSCDIASNAIRRTFPKGLDAEAFFLDTLLRIDRLARSPASREHLLRFACVERPDLFEMRSVEIEEDHSQLNWSVDTKEDLARVREIYERLDLASQMPDWREVLASTTPSS